MFVIYFDYIKICLNDCYFEIKKYKYKKREENKPVDPFRIVALIKNQKEACQYVSNLNRKEWELLKIYR